MRSGAARGRRVLPLDRLERNIAVFFTAEWTLVGNKVMSIEGLGLVSAGQFGELKGSLFKELKHLSAPEATGANNTPLQNERSVYSLLVDKEFLLCFLRFSDRTKNLFLNLFIPVSHVSPIGLEFRRYTP